MTKKDKQRQNWLLLLESILKNIKVEKSVIKNILIENSIKETVVNIPPVFFEPGVKYTECRFCKVKKGDFRVDVLKNGKWERYPKRFKSITSANEWCLKHTA